MSLLEMVKDHMDKYQYKSFTWLVRINLSIEFTLLYDGNQGEIKEGGHELDLFSNAEVDWIGPFLSGDFIINCNL